ncbi:tetratricopeptide repeat protein 36 [Schistocerca gregaria]|uniref:tetratricopeptide repeat protein 36 n=1 Tax=Schistocerca cancellata TaxID=274614 RepID=UPI002119941F|nr:tetratricopeptide repeat protein 36 [Schistocerca cancellata]XP_049860321.1 tetratricopeptide repeat protein 36 [Schistocerca gregaria]
MSTQHDREILDTIFNPLGPLADKLPDEATDESVKDEEDESDPTVKAAKQLEMDAVTLAESGNIEAAINLFTKAIATAPSRPSAYNNRAQAYRLGGKISEAVADLNLAIQLSNGRGKSGCQALCQRGIIHRKEGNDDLAKEDFKAAANLGSKFAKHQLVEMNPYAALCNQMLHDVMKKLQAQEA